MAVVGQVPPLANDGFRASHLAVVASLANGALAWSVNQHSRGDESGHTPLTYVCHWRTLIVGLATRSPQGGPQDLRSTPGGRPGQATRHDRPGAAAGFRRGRGAAQA